MIPIYIEKAARFNAMRLELVSTGQLRTRYPKFEWARIPISGADLLGHSRTSHPTFRMSCLACSPSDSCEWPWQDLPVGIYSSGWTLVLLNSLYWGLEITLSLRESETFCVNMKFNVAFGSRSSPLLSQFLTLITLPQQHHFNNTKACLIRLSPRRCCPIARV